MIELINVKKKYKKKKLFSKVNIKIEKAGIYCFVGDNGCGKTTLLNLIGGFVKISSGKIRNKLKNCSFISQKVNLLENVNIENHLKMFNLDVSLLKKVHLFSKKDKYPNELSFGMKQRVAVLLGLHSEASLVILDEPTSHLDYYNGSILMREIKRVSENKIIILVCHDEKFVNKYSDVVYEIKDNKINLIKKNEKNNFVKIYKYKRKKLKRYFVESIKKNIKINLCYSIILFFLLLIFNLTINLKENFSFYLKNSEVNALDYNKFYLKQCKEEMDDKIVVKKCSNLDDDKIRVLKENNYKLSLNYDALLNDLYNTNNFNVINQKEVNLKEGRYPTYYNEVIANSDYKLGDEIVLDSFKIIEYKKTDIYKNRLILKVVGISNNTPFVKDNKIYLDYSLFEDYLKKENLINNKITMFDYFYTIDMNNYKHVIYFEKIDLEFLKSNNIEYLSSSYDYYKSLEETFDEIVNSLNIVNIFVAIFVIFYSFKLIKKKVKNKHDDIIFFKASGVNKKNIIKIINKENNLFVVISSVFALLFNILIFNIIFGEFSFNGTIFIVLILFVSYLNKKILKKEIKRKMTI